MSQLIDQILKKARASCIPLVTTIEITQNCNFQCKHCYNFDRAEEMPSHYRNQQLSEAEIIRVIDEIATAGALYLNLSGGEALLHPHLEKFISHAKKLHLEVRLKTNGSLLTSEKCQSLEKAGLGGMDVSLYGFSETSYEILTGKKHSFNKSVAGIINANEAGLDVSVSLILHRYNLHEMKEMEQFCNSLNLNYQFSTEITERYDDSSGAKDFEITEEQFLEQLNGEFSDLFNHFNTEKSLQCSCARSVCGISSSGEVYPCIGAPIPSGNIRDKTFMEIWKNSPVLNRIRGLEKQDFKTCSTCDHIDYCNRSSGSIYTNTKNYTGCDPVTFRQAKSRHEFSATGTQS